MPNELRFIGNPKAEILIGLIPHENEPLGTIIRDINLPKDVQSDVELCINLDIPEKPRRFELPSSFKEFFLEYKLSSLENQIEFSYTNYPITEKEKRAYSFFEKAKQKKLVILLHNDPIRDFFYLYSHNNYEQINDKISLVNQHILQVNSTLSDTLYTEKLNDFIYEYFPFNKIHPDRTPNEACGIYFKKKGIPVITLEIPMFEWSILNTQKQHLLKNLYLHSVSNNLTNSERVSLINKNNIQIDNLPMVSFDKITESLRQLIPIIINTLLRKETVYGEHL